MTRACGKRKCPSHGYLGTAMLCTRLFSAPRNSFGVSIVRALGIMEYMRLFVSTVPCFPSLKCLNKSNKARGEGRKFKKTLEGVALRR